MVGLDKWWNRTSSCHLLILCCICHLADTLIGVHHTHRINGTQANERGKGDELKRVHRKGYGHSTHHRSSDHSDADQFHSTECSVVEFESGFFIQLVVDFLEKWKDARVLHWL